MLLVLDIQVFERGDEGLGLEASGGSRGNGRVADGALCADGGDVAPQRRSEVASFIPGLSHAANVETPAEVNTVQDLKETGEQAEWRSSSEGCTAQNGAFSALS